MNQSSYKQWLDSSKDWAYPLGNAWKGSKVLGKGSFGVVGLWQLEGGGDGASPTINKIVVKQNIDASGFQKTLKEGDILYMLSNRPRPSKHILRAYDPPRIDVYQNVNVARIILEFCPAGTLSKLIEADRNRGQEVSAPKEPVAEVDMWAIFNCLALGVAMIDRGTEDPNAASWRSKTTIVHYDIKPDNILLGFRDQKHLRIPICKIADFGEAVEESVVQDRKMGAEFRSNGNGWWRPPEATFGEQLKNPRKDARTNVFQIGCLIHCLATRRMQPFRSSTPYTSQLNDRLRPGYTQGDMDNPQSGAPRNYSVSLRGLIMECMMQEPSYRPGSIELQTRTARGLQVASDTSREVAVRYGFQGVPIVGLEGLWEPDLDLMMDLEDIVEQGHNSWDEGNENI